MDITILFNPAFDKGVYVPENESGKATFGRCYVGTKGLLDELELRLGLTSPVSKAYKQLEQYAQAAQKAAQKNTGFFFGQSLKLTPRATARQLLQWRDELVLAGWNKDFAAPEGLTPGAKSILAGLRAIEEQLPESFATEADRWLRVEKELKGPVKGLKVECSLELEKLHPFFREILGKLGATEKLMGEGAKEPVIKHFRDSVDAMLWAAAQGGEALLVADDPLTLSAAQQALGKPETATAYQSTAHPVDRLFVCAMKLLADKDNLNLIRGYLAAPRHPLNDFKLKRKGEAFETTLREALLNNLTLQGGMGTAKVTKQSFQDLINEFGAAEGNDSDEIAKLLVWQKGNLKAGTIKSLCKRLKEWAEKAIKTKTAMNAYDTYLPQYQSICDSCEAMVHIVNAMGLKDGDEMSKKDFDMAVDYAYTPTTATCLQAKVGAVEVADSIESIALPVGDTIWIAPSAPRNNYPILFMCDNDVAELREKGLKLQTQQEYLKMRDAAFNQGLSCIEGRLTILSCDKSCGEVQSKHPYLLRTVMEKEEGKENPAKYLSELPYCPIPEEKGKSLDIVSPNTPDEEHTFNREDLKEKGKPAFRDYESASAIEKLLEHPFDYFVKYVLELWESNEGNLGQVQGTVAHAVIQKIYEAGKVKTGSDRVDGGTFGRLSSDKKFFDQVYDQAIEECGMMLNLPENQYDREVTKGILFGKSLPTLTDLLKSNGWTIVGVEVSFNGTKIAHGKQTIEMTGQIDMVVQKEDEHYFILDFKWAGSTGLKDREGQIKQGKDYQLAIYRKMFETANKGAIVDGQAFYMLKQSQLLTATEGLQCGGQPIEALHGRNQKTYEQTVADLFEKYFACRSEIENGTVKEGKKDKYGNNNILKGKLK